MASSKKAEDGSERASRSAGDSCIFSAGAKTAQRIARISALVAEELAVLDRNVGGKDGRYAMPWCLVLGVPALAKVPCLRITDCMYRFVALPTRNQTQPAVDFGTTTKGSQSTSVAMLCRTKMPFGICAACCRVRGPSDRWTAQLGSSDHGVYRRNAAR